MDIFAVPNAQTRDRVPPIRWTQAVVDGVSGGLVDLEIEDEVITGIPFLASYSPTPGDVVEVLSSGAKLLVLGKI